MGDDVCFHNAATLTGRCIPSPSCPSEASPHFAAGCEPCQLHAQASQHAASAHHPAFVHRMIRRLTLGHGCSRAPLLCASDCMPHNASLWIRQGYSILCTQSLTSVPCRMDEWTNTHDTRQPHVTHSLRPADRYLRILALQ